MAVRAWCSRRTRLPELDGVTRTAEERLDQVRLQAHVQDDQQRMMLAHAPLLFLVSAAVAVLGAVIFHDILPRTAIQAWVVVMLAVSIARYTTYSVARPNLHDAATMRSCLRRYTTLTFCTGVGWALMTGLVLWRSDQSSDHYLMLLLLAGLSGGSTGSMGTWLPTFLAYNLPMLLVTLIALLIRGSSTDLTMAGVVLIYAATVLILTFRHNKEVRSAIAAQRRYELLLEDYRAQLERAERANASKSRFIAAASHDLRQPVQAALLFADTLSRETRPSQAARLVEGVRNALNQLSSLLTNLLEVSRLDAGQDKPELTWVPIDAVLVALDQEFAAMARSHGIWLKVRSGGWVARTDKTMLLRILRNLITNAILHSEGRKIVVGCRPEANGLRIVVIDNGRGIADEHLVHLTEEFYQANNQHRDPQMGYGLGLAIVARLSRLLDHPVRLKTRLGHGTSFWVSLPQAEKLVDESALLDLQEPEPTLHGMTLWLVEDDAQVGPALANAVSSYGADVRLAPCRETLRSWWTAGIEPPDGIVLDWRLPEGITGYDVVLELADRLPRPVPLIILSGEAVTELIEQQQWPAGWRPRAVLQKPVDPLRLVFIFSATIPSLSAGLAGPGRSA